MSDAFWAYGSQIQAGDGAVSEAFTSVSEVKKLTPPKLSRAVIDVTHMLSPNGYKEYIPGWRDGGEMNYEANWLPTDATQDAVTGLHASFNDNLVHNWRLLIPDVLYISFSGFITAHEPDTPLEDGAKIAGTIKISGEPTVTLL